MNADKIVRALRECGDCDTCPYYDCWIDEHTGDPADACDEGRLFRDVIALIESLQAQLEEWKSKHRQAALNYQQKCRDVAGLETQLSASQRRADAAVEDILCADHCDVCMHKDSGTSCERVDYECGECDDPVCVCRCCRDEDKWEWRGNAE